MAKRHLHSTMGLDRSVEGIQSKRRDGCNVEFMAMEIVASCTDIESSPLLSTSRKAGNSVI